jgi:hypothetical protein
VEKLFEVAEEGGPTCGWCEGGDGFLVKSVREFEADVLLPRFGHGNYASFVRQLNQYGFHKDRSCEDAVFRNPNFLRHKPEQLCFVLRRQGSSSAKVGGQSDRPQNSSSESVGSCFFLCECLKSRIEIAQRC